MKRTQKLVTWGIVILVVLVVLLMLVSNLCRSSRGGPAGHQYQCRGRRRPACGGRRPDSGGGDAGNGAGRH